MSTKKYYSSAILFLVSIMVIERCHGVFKNKDLNKIKSTKKYSEDMKGLLTLTSQGESRRE